MQTHIPYYIPVLFLSLVLVLLFFILKYLNESLNKTYEKIKTKRIILITTSILILWLLFLYLLSTNNILNNYSAMPPRMLLVIIPPLIVALIFTFSKTVLSWLKNVPLQYLIYLQTFRVVVEFILWLLYRNNIIPVQMTFEGRNYDILIGLSALFTGYYYVKGIEFFKNKWVLIFWNVAGLILLANIVVIAILSAPFPFRQFMNEPANTIIFYFPYVLLPGFLVPVAYTTHLLSLKKLLSEKNTS